MIYKYTFFQNHVTSFEMNPDIIKKKKHTSEHKIKTKAIYLLLNSIPIEHIHMTVDFPSLVRIQARQSAGVKLISFVFYKRCLKEVHYICFVQ